MQFVSELRASLLSRRPSESGQTLVEYGLLVTLLAMAAILILGVVGQDVTSLFTTVSTQFRNAATP
jgi:Flp pilus assembly pilin Flp